MPQTQTRRLLVRLFLITFARSFSSCEMFRLLFSTDKLAWTFWLFSCFFFVDYLLVIR